MDPHVILSQGETLCLLWSAAPATKRSGDRANRSRVTPACPNYVLVLLGLFYFAHETTVLVAVLVLLIELVHRLS